MKILDDFAKLIKSGEKIPVWFKENIDWIRKYEKWILKYLKDETEFVVYFIESWE